MHPTLRISRLAADPRVIESLADLLVETVAAGGSVSFMHPLAPATAAEFWTRSLAAAGRDERVLLGAWDGDRLAATVTLHLDCPPNQPHRGEIAKLMTRVSHRRRGIARALMIRAETIAIERGRTLLTLDTGEDDGAAGLYESLGFERAGVIPDYAFKPHGGLQGTVIYYKRIGPDQASRSSGRIAISNRNEPASSSSA
jgi:ribosomal protein S18 acetylase RimI-like enzyme